MEVPFTRVGPGQSVRLAWQVLGSNGPIPNPTGIRYIPPCGGTDAAMPSSAPFASPPMLPADASAVMGYVQLANLGVGVTNLVISTATLKEVTKQTRMLGELQLGLTDVQSGVQRLLVSTERIDLNVAQVELRETLRHALRSAARNDEVDLVVLADYASRALTRFLESVPGGLAVGTQRNLTLAADVREMAEATMHLLWAARLTAVQEHNIACAGDPARVVRDDRLQHFMARVSRSAAVLATLGSISGLADNVGEASKGSWPFSGGGDDARKLVDTQLREMQSSLDRLSTVKQARTLLKELNADEPFAKAVERGGDALVGLVNDYLLAWTARTDAGLLWRLRLELELHSDESYWSGLDGWLEQLSATGGDVLGVMKESVLALPAAAG